MAIEEGGAVALTMIRLEDLCLREVEEGKLSLKCSGV